MNKISSVAAGGCFFKELADVFIGFQVFCNIK